MTNREVELILKMRDQATAVWNRFEGGIRGGAQRMGRFMSQNWASMGAGALAAFYIIAQALEKIDKIAKKVGKAIGEQTGGSVQNVARQMKELSSMIELIRKIADESLIRTGLWALGIGKSIAVFFASLVFIIAKPMALIEEGMNALGITSSTFFQNLANDSGALAMKLSKEATDAFSAAFASSKELGLGFEGLRDRVKRLKDELDSMDPTTSAYIAKYREWKLAADQLANAEERARLIATQGHKLRGEAIRLEVTDLQKLVNTAALYKEQLEFMAKYGPGNNQIMKMADDFKEVSTTIPELFGENWQIVMGEVSNAGYRAANEFYSFFNGNIQGVKGLVKSLSITIREQFKQLAAELAGQALFAAILSLIFPSTGFADFASAGGGLLGMIAGKKPSGGASNSRQSSDIIEQINGSSGATIIFNNYAPMTKEEAIVETLSNVVRSTGQSIDKIVLNNRSKVALNPA